MKTWFALLASAAVVVVSYTECHSTGGFLVLAFGSLLLLDRYILRLLPGPPLLWRREVAIRFGAFLLGGAAFYLMRPGIVPLWEAAYRGLIVSLGSLLLECAAGAFRRPMAGWVVAGFGVAGVVFLSPVIAALHPLHTVPKRTPAAFGLPYEDVRFQTEDGVELAAWIVPHDRARGNVIFCHGHGRNRGHVAGVLATLHGLGLNVLAFDFRGHGDSEGLTSTFGHREVNDLRAAEAYLRGRFPDQPMLLVGVSLGAAVSLQALPQLPEVRGVWSEGAFARFEDVVDHFFQSVPAVLRRPQVEMYERIGWLDSGLWVPSVNPVECLESTRTPIFFCHAVDDELIPLDQGLTLYSAYRGPRECWWVPGASHYDVRQRNHEEYLQRLRGFLDGCLTARSGERVRK